MVVIISLLSIARRGYFASQQLRNYRQNYSLSCEIRESVDYAAPVSLMVTSIVDFDTDGHLILDLGFELKTATIRE